MMGNPQIAHQKAQKAQKPQKAPTKPENSYRETASTAQTVSGDPETNTMKRKRVYNGPTKGSEEAKARMAAVRAHQYAKNNLVYRQ